VYLVGFIIRIYHDARSPEREVLNILFCIWKFDVFAAELWFTRVLLETLLLLCEHLAIRMKQIIENFGLGNRTKHL